MDGRIDHLVVAAPTLEQGVRWCEDTLGVAPQPGGRHAFMGTHNRLLSVAGPDSPQAYLEIIAIDPAAPPPGRPRWFDLDDPGLQARLRASPRLVHWVVACDDAGAAAGRMRATGPDPGPLVAAHRETPHGTLRWRLTVPTDGRLRCAGAWPTVIQWDDGHPSQRLPDQGLRLQGLHLRGLPGGGLPLRVPQVDTAPGPGPALELVLHTPQGERVLRSDEDL